MKNIIFIFLLFLAYQSPAQFEPNYDESKISDFILPENLVSNGNKKITNVDQWEKIRRPEILELFKSEVYGKIPDHNVEVRFRIVDIKKNVLDGLAERKQIDIIFSREDKMIKVDLLIYLPTIRIAAVPIFLALNFDGNHTIYPDFDILVSDSWVDNEPKVGIFNNISNELSRGYKSNRWPVPYILSRGYGIAVIHYGDIDPDYDDDFQNGIHPLFYKDGQSKPAPDEWGSIGAWAYGLIQTLNYFETDDSIDHTKVAVIGHSRLGKTSLWAGALDERFALVISNESGCGGAALSRRKIGETVGRINTVFPHWFSDNFNKYNENEDALPVDQHMLIALMAPRPVYIASAKGDRWADPMGEFLSGAYASTVYNLYGLKGLDKDKMPLLNSPVNEGHIGYHIRFGEHGLTYYDWEQFLNFADRFLK
jgi:hypothetical protein